MRKYHIDYAKGLGILAVFWGHIMLKGWSYSLVYSFTIPLFFFLSGFVFHDRKYPTLGSFFAARWKSLILPYLSFSIVTWAVWVVYLPFFGTVPQKGIWYPLLQTLIAQGSSGYLIHNTPLWFPPCLFLVELLYYGIRNWRSGSKVVFSLVLAAVGYWMIQDHSWFNFRTLPYSMEAAASAFLFYTAGHLTRERFGMDPIGPLVQRRPALYAWLLAGLTAVLLVLSGWNGHVTLGSNDLGKNVFVFYLGAFVGIASVTLAANLLAAGPRGVLETLLGFLGRNSFYVMAVHFPVKRFVVAVLAKHYGMKQTPLMKNFPKALLAFCISLPITCAIVWALEKRKQKRAAKAASA